MTFHEIVKRLDLYHKVGMFLDRRNGLDAITGRLDEITVPAIKEIKLQMSKLLAKLACGDFTNDD